jgi:hypothetical protein
MLGQNLNRVKNFLYEKDLKMDGKEEQPLPLTTEEKQYMVTYMRHMEAHCKTMYGEGSRYEESAKQVNRIVDIADRLTNELSESEESDVDKVVVTKEMKRIREDAKLYEKSCQEAALAEARAKHAYENLIYEMNRLYGQ